MSNDDNAVYGYNLKEDTNIFPDNQKLGFIIYGDRKDILSFLEDAYAYVLERYPQCEVVREYDDGTLRDMPVIDPTVLTDEERKDVINMMQGFYIDQKFTVGSVETKTNRQWLYDAFGVEDIPESVLEEDYQDVEVESTTVWE